MEALVQSHSVMLGKFGLLFDFMDNLLLSIKEAKELEIKAYKQMLPTRAGTPPSPRHKAWSAKAQYCGEECDVLRMVGVDDYERVCYSFIKKEIKDSPGINITIYAKTTDYASIDTLEDAVVKVIFPEHEINGDLLKIAKITGSNPQDTDKVQKIAEKAIEVMMECGAKIFD